jgi:hypothetical protein
MKLIELLAISHDPFGNLVHYVLPSSNHIRAAISEKKCTPREK